MLNIQPLYFFLIFFFFSPNFPLSSVLKSGSLLKLRQSLSTPSWERGGDEMPEMCLGAINVLPADLSSGTVKLLLLYTSTVMDSKNIKIPGNFQEEFTTSVSVITIPTTSRRNSARKANIIIHLRVCLYLQITIHLSVSCIAGDKML